jgi:PAS domain S-box-containing protein
MCTMLTTDQECRIVEWSAAARELLGFEAAEVRGRSLFEVLGATDPFGNRLCPHGCGLQEMARQGQPVRMFEMEAAASAGARVRLIASVSLAPAAGRRSLRRFVFHLRPDLRRRGERRRLDDRRRGDSNLAVDGAPGSILDFWDLSPREREVLHHLVSGATTRDLAARLGITSTTARNHANHLLRKMGVHSRLEAVALASRHGVT